MDRNTFFLRGEVDLASVDGVLRTLRSVAGLHAGTVVVDCRGLTFIDLAGIRALIQVHAELAQAGRELVLVHPSPMLTRVLQVLDLTDLLRPMPLSVRAPTSAIAS